MLRSLLVAAASAALLSASFAGVGEKPHLTVALSSAFLAGDNQVKPEIKLTKDQDDKFTAIMDGYMTKQQALSKPGTAEEKFEELNVVTAQEIMAILEPTQKSRLLEIHLQKSGVIVLPDSEIAKAIGLEAGQVKTISGLVTEMTKKEEDFEEELSNALMTIPNDTTVSQEALEKKRMAVVKQIEPKRIALEAQKKEYETKIYAVMTTPQFSKWKEMQGAKFEPNKKSGG